MLLSRQSRMKLLGMAGVALGLSATLPAWANCEPAGAQVIPIALGGSVSVPLATAVGQVFKTVMIPQGLPLLTCDEHGATLNVQLGPVRTGAPGGNDGVINTQYPGLGMRVTLDVTGDGRLTDLPATHGVTLQLPANSQNWAAPAMKVELIKTRADLAAGQLPAGALFSVPLTVTGADMPDVNITLQSEPLTLAATGCIVKTPNLTVPMPSIPASRFGKVGNTAGETDFSLAFLCAEGQSVRMKTSGIASVEVDGNTLGILANTALKNAATGVGVQVMYNGSPIPLNAADWTPLGKYSNDIAIPFSARYYQTTLPVSAGNVEAMMSFTLDYN